MAGFTFVGREALITSFRELLARPEGELVVIGGAEGTGKSHLLRRFRREAEAPGSHFVQLNDLSYLPDADLRHYAIISALAAGHSAEPEGEGEGSALPELLPNPRQFLDNLMTEDRRPPCEKLLRVFSAASAHLGDRARLVLLLDLGRAAGEEAFPTEFLARRLPDKVKLVVATTEPPEGLGRLDWATLIPELPALNEAEATRLLEFHLPDGEVTPELMSVVTKRYQGQPMALDLAGKIAAASPNTAEALASLPTAPAALCTEMLTQLSDGQRALVECIARVPSGVDIACLRALTDFTDPELARLLRSGGIRNVAITQRKAQGPQAFLFHDLLADGILAAAPDDTPEARTFHQLAAGFFLAAVEADPTDVVALSAHRRHLRLSGDKGQFIHDFPRTYKAKHSFRLFAQLADEYRQLIDYCDELGETGINRPACLANLGRVYQELGQNEAALDVHQQALALYEQASDAAGAAEQLANTATVLQTLGQLDQAIEHLQRATSLDEAADNQQALAADLNNLGIVYQELQRYDDALECHQRALDLHEAFDNDLGRANQLANMAAIHRARSDLHAARECYQKAWVIDTRTGNVLAQVVDLCNLGLIFQELGDMEKAILSYQQVIDIDRAVADREAEAAHLRTLARMHLEIQHHNDAIEILQQTLEIDRSIGNPAGEATDLLDLASAFRAANELAMARDLLQRAAEAFAQLGDDDAQQAALRTLQAVDRQIRGEATQDDEKPQPQPERKQTQIIQREPASDGIWSNLQLIDDEHPAAPQPHNPAPEPQPEPKPTPEPQAEAAPGLELIDDDLALEPHDPTTTDDDTLDTSSALLDLTSEVADTLRRERDEARQRVAELEAELKSYKDLVNNLRGIVGQLAPKD